MLLISYCLHKWCGASIQRLATRAHPHCITTSVSSETPRPPPPASFALLTHLRRRRLRLGRTGSRPPAGSPAPGAALSLSKGGRRRRRPGVPLHAMRRLDRGVQEALDPSTRLRAGLEGDVAQGPQVVGGLPRIRRIERIFLGGLPRIRRIWRIFLRGLPRIRRIWRIFLGGLPRIRRIERIFCLNSPNTCTARRRKCSRNSRHETRQRVAQACTEHRRSGVGALVEGAEMTCPGRRLRVELAEVVDADGDVGHGCSVQQG